MKTYLAVIGLTLATFVGPVMPAAEEEDYPSIALPTKYPAAFRSWQKIVPDNLRRFTWLSSFHGPEGPMETIDKDGKRFFLGSACKAHDCGNNGVSFLIAVDGSQAYGLIRSAEASGGMNLFLGGPNEEVKNLLLDRLPPADE